MKTYASKTGAEKTQAASHASVEKQDQKDAIQLKDNRSGSIARQKMWNKMGQQQETRQLVSAVMPNTAVTTAADQPYQLQAIIHTEAYDRKKLYGLIQERLKSYANPILTDVVRYALIPTLVDEGYTYQDMPFFDLQFNEYLKIMNRYTLDLFSLDLPELIEAQHHFQSDIARTNPMLMATLTTSGFEFEFLQMTDESPLKGLSHLELAKTGPYGLTHLPFSIETDSNSEIELVTPPFLIPTLGTGSLPHPKVLKHINQLFHKALLPLQAKAHALSSQEDSAKGMQGLVTLLTNTLGIVFHLAPQKVKTHNLSYNAQPEQVKGLLGKKPDGKLLSTIKFKDRNEKYSEDKPIASQVNFASSAGTLGVLLSQETLKEDLIGVFSPLYAFWHQYLTQKAPGLPFDYLEHVVQKLASIYAVPMQKTVLDELFALRSKIEHNQELPNEDQQTTFVAIANLISFVKDVKHIWVKDDLINITRAYLKNEQVCQGIEGLDLSDLPGEISGVVDRNLLSWGIGQKRDQINQAYIKDCITAIKMVKAVCKGTHPENHHKRVDFLQHDPNYIGGRQDTYLDLNQQTGAKGTKRRYVGELRDGGLERLEEMGNKIIGTEHAKYENDHEVVELNEQLLKEHSDKLYQSAYKTYLPEKEKPNDDDFVDPMSNFLGQDILLSDSGSSNDGKTKHKGKKKRKKDKKKKDKKKKKKVEGNPRAEAIKRLVRTTAEGEVAVGDIPGRLAGTFFGMGVTNTEIEAILAEAPQMNSLEDLLNLIDRIIK